MPRLPLELCDMVIGNLNADLSDDQATLCVCSPTCRAFLPASRYRLSYHVALSDRRTAERFLKVICSTQTSTSPIPFIGRLSVYGRRSWQNDAFPILATRLLPQARSCVLEPARRKCAINVTIWLPEGHSLADVAQHC
jgi:hypothetical protein